MSTEVDLRPKPPAEKQPPANIELEQMVLGCVLYDNEAYHRCDGLTAAHFYEPFHGRLWDAIAARIGKGNAADPVLLDETFRNDAAYQELGHIRYTADLVDRAPPAVHAGDYASEIIDISLRRNLIRVCGEGAAQADEDRDHTGREIVGEIEQQLFALGETTNRQGFRSFSDYLTGAIEMAAEAHQRDGSVSGISTGLMDIDQKIGGLHPSDLIIIAARPSMGKTSLACNIAFDVAKHFKFEVQPDGLKKTISGGVVAFFSMEMSGEQLAMRLLAEASRVSGDKIRKGQIEKHEFGHIVDAAEMIRSIPLHIDATAGLTIGRLAARARRLKRTGGLDLVVVDYLQLMRGDRTYRGGERVQEVTEITVGLKALAKDLNVPVVALSQLSRQVENREDKRPQLSDLRESGSIEQDADMVMFLYREEYYLSRTEPRDGTPEHMKWQDEMQRCRGQADAIIAKQRHGPIGTVRLSFNADTTKFGNSARPTIDFTQATFRNLGGAD
jgi:replicative DNA helicase